MSRRSGDLASRLTDRYTIQPNGCWEWSKSRMPSGYGYLKYMYKTWLAHRAAYTVWVGPIPEGMHVLHSCDNPPCCNPDHLRLGVDQDNADDRVARDRIAFGSRSGQAKISEQEVREIKDLYASKIFIQREIGALYNLTQSSISQIVGGTSWKRVA